MNSGEMLSGPVERLDFRLRTPVSNSPRDKVSSSSEFGISQPATHNGVSVPSW